ncbi:MAG: hypothetical protein ACXVIJ_09395, partial [Thermoanaerobaculia bacterium]
IVLSYVNHNLLRFICQTRVRDISCGLRLVRRDVVRDLDLVSSSPFIGAEIAIKTLLHGFRVGEVGVQTFPREFGKGSSTSFRNIMATIRDMRLVHRRIFSSDYEVPMNRKAKESDIPSAHPRRGSSVP